MFAKPLFSPNINVSPLAAGEPTQIRWLGMKTLNDICTELCSGKSISQCKLLQVDIVFLVIIQSLLILSKNVSLSCNGGYRMKVTNHWLLLQHNLYLPKEIYDLVPPDMIS